MEFNSVAFVPIASLTTAFLAGAIAALTLIVNKENKISEFRQAWIDGLRDDLANFFSASRTCTRALQEGKIARQKEQFKNPMPIDEATTTKLRHQVAECSYRIRLRLNEEKASHIKLEALMTQSATLVSEYFSGNTDDVEKVLSGIETTATQAREVLKTEWERVKKGEVAYRVAKWVAVILALITAVAILTIGWKSFSLTQVTSKLDSVPANTFSARVESAPPPPPSTPASRARPSK